MNKVIVFGNDHTNSVGVIQSLGLAGIKSIGLLFGVKTRLTVSSKFTERVITGSDAQNCIDKLLGIDFNTKTPIPIIATCDMAALTLERNKEKLNDRFVFEHSTNYSLEYLAKKNNQVCLAAKSGFNVPKSWDLGNSKDIPQDVTFPCIIKPIVSCEGSKSDIRVCRTFKDLEENLKALVHTQNVILQQYIERDYEISILGCGLSNGKCLIPAVENKLTLYPKYVGLECLADIQPITDETIKSCVMKLITEIGYIGLFSVEMMHCKEDNKFYFTEINLRNDGAEAFITKYGANLPLNHVEDLLNLPITLQNTYYPGNYIWDMHHFLSFIHRDISFFKWIREIKQSNGFLLYFKEDPKPFYKQYSNWVLTKLHLRKHETYK